MIRDDHMVVVFEHLRNFGVMVAQIPGRASSLQLTESTYKATPERKDFPRPGEVSPQVTKGEIWTQSGLRGFLYLQTRIFKLVFANNL